MVAEAAGDGINWLEPRDLDVGKMTFRINPPAVAPDNNIADISSCHATVAYVLFCDGSMRGFPSSIDPKLLAALTTIDGCETVNQNDF